MKENSTFAHSIVPKDLPMKNEWQIKYEELITENKALQAENDRFIEEIKRVDSLNRDLVRQNTELIKAIGAIQLLCKAVM